jgi:transcriptional regulator with XRE-family HTH domain
MDAATAIRQAREQAGLSKRELARRARTSPAAIVLYESGAREPSYATLKRIVGAAGFETRLTMLPRPASDRAVLGRRLIEVLELAEHLPRRRASRRMAFPPFRPPERQPAR